MLKCLVDITFHIKTNFKEETPLIILIRKNIEWKILKQIYLNSLPMYIFPINILKTSTEFATLCFISPTQPPQLCFIPLTQLPQQSTSSSKGASFTMQPIFFLLYFYTVTPNHFPMRHTLVSVIFIYPDSFCCPHLTCWLIIVSWKIRISNLRDLVDSF